MYTTYSRFLYRGRWVLAILFTLLFVFCVREASRLKLRSDFKELLPENFQSVKDMNRILERVSGEGSLNLAIESPDPQTSIRFANDLIAKLKEYPPQFIRRIEYNISDTKKFFEDHKYLYMNLEDVQEMHDRFKHRIESKKLKTTGLLINFEDEDDGEFTTKDLEDKYKTKTGQYDDYIDGYLFGEKGKLMVVILRPPGSATGIEFSRSLIAKLEGTIAELQPAKYHPEMKVGMTGKFRRTLFEYQALVDDIVSTALLCVALVGLAVLIYFRRIRMVFLMAWATINGVVWAFAITRYHIGYLTTQTAFLGSIIVGNGINYSLIFMARYLEERKEGKSPLDALTISLPATFAGTLASSLTTAVGFAVLMFTDIRGFSQFGFIGAIGMFCCWIATYTLLPAFLAITEEIWPVVNPRKKEKVRLSMMVPLAHRLPRWASRLTFAGLILSILSVPLMIYFVPRSLEYDFTKLRVKAKGQAITEDDALNARVKAVLTKATATSALPSIILTDSVDQVIPLCQEVMRRNNQDSPEKRVVEDCKTVYSFLPQDQDKKLELLADMRQMLESNSLKFLNEEQLKQVEKFKAEFQNKPVELKDLPPTILKNFEEKNGEVGRMVQVYSGDRVPLWDGKNLIRFANIIRENTLPTGEKLTGAGDSVIFADLLQAIINDGPWATLLSFVGVCGVVVLLFREVRAIIFIVGTLVLGVLWMGGVISLFQIKINFFNFIAIPTTFGIGIDYGVNIYQRYRLEGPGSLPKVIRTTGGAVVLCSITTIIGYFTLIIAKNRALVSFGWIGIIGELTCLLAAILIIPAYVIWREKHQTPMT